MLCSDGLRNRRNSSNDAHAASTTGSGTGTISEEIEITPLLISKEEQEQDASDGYLLIPLKQRSVFARLDVGPFLVAYSILIGLDYSNYYDESIPDLFSQIAFPAVLLLHISLFLLQEWNVLWRATVGYQKLPTSHSHSPQIHTSNNNIHHQWTHCLVEAPHMDKHHSKQDADICPVQFQFQENVAIVNFQDIIFRCSPMVDADATLWMSSSASKHQAKSQQPSITLAFHRLQYPIHLPLSFYQSYPGHVSLDQVKQAQRVYGWNTTPIQLPPFLELLQAQVVAPFFLFQILCCLLWSLDEYWYYALFTFFALLLFESTVAYNRLQSLQRLRSHTDLTPRHMYAYRPAFPPGKAGWVQVLVSELVPGDVVSCKPYTPTRVNNRNQHQQPKAAVMNRIPADILVLQGDAVVDEALLTGESIPQLKVGVDGNDDTTKLDLQEHKQSMLWGGTILLVSNGGSGSSGGPNNIPQAPDQGVVGMVLRTGFDTAQGSLLRTMAHTTKSVDGIHTTDTYVFIMLLLCCAIASASMVWTQGWADPSRNKFRLVLHVIIIVTSVVPPELPMELSLAVTSSVADLMKRSQVYCTEVFRIPLAGQVQVCCFDKTGTLTSDEVQLRGIRMVQNGSFTDVTPPDDGSIPWPVARVMVACHSLALNGMVSGQNGSNVIGDPLEKVILKDTGYALIQNNALRAVTTTEGRPNTVLVLHRFNFTSRLKRMSVIVAEDTGSDTWVLTKGAPETIRDFLTPESLPADYDEICKHHMGLGQRVLAIAYRRLVGSIGNVKELDRASVERDLMFAGFLLLDCPLKPDSRSIILELQSSGHDVVMITGDAVLTAAEVARQVGIIDKRAASRIYQLQSNEESKVASDALSGFSWGSLSSKSSDGDSKKHRMPLSLSKLESMQRMVLDGEISLCVSGDTLLKLALAVVQESSSAEGIAGLAKKDEKHVLLHPAVQELLKELVPLISVFARHAPRQKEAVVAAFNLRGYHTLMCGDGTNDVGALRRAHVGISIISAPEVEAKQRSASETISKFKAEQKKERKEKKKGKKSVKSSNHTSSSALERSLRQLREAQDELDHVELGDASVASPFTSRTVSIKCCKDVLQQGRCTLVTMLQIYKILGINCLVNAMVLSKLFLHGVKQGDRQLTILGVAVAALFFFVTRGKPLDNLSPLRPPSSVLCAQALCSITVQFGIHFGAILIATEAALSFVDPYDPSMIPDGPFNPNTLNTCTFLMNVLATVNTFAVNYRGEPFTEPLRENKMLLRSLQVCYGVLFVCALEIFPPLNDLLQLTEFPSTTGSDEIGWQNAELDRSPFLAVVTGVVASIGFPLFMCCLMLFDTGLAFAAETIIIRTFEY
jgi:cation-transporting ATPase 13A1